MTITECKTKPKIADQPLVLPFTVLVDQREQLAWSFNNIRGDAKQHNRLLVVRSAPAHLHTGDYSIRSCDRFFAIERKSKCDLYGTLGGGRERFQSELERLSRIPSAHVIVESQIDDVLADPPPYSKLNPKTIPSSVAAWVIRFPSVHWWFMPGRVAAERWALRLMRRFWEDLDNQKNNRRENEQSE